MLTTISHEVILKRKNVIDIYNSSESYKDVLKTTEERATFDGLLKESRDKAKQYLLSKFKAPKVTEVIEYREPDRPEEFRYKLYTPLIVHS